MGLSCKVGSFSSGTGALSSSVSVTGLGFNPSSNTSIAIFWWSGRTDTTDAAGSATHMRGFGYAISASVRGVVVTQSSDNEPTADCDGSQRTDACVAVRDVTAITGLLDFASWDSDGFTLTVDDAMPASLRIHYMVLSGSDLTIATAGVLTEPGATGNQDITVTGFASGASDQCVLFLAAGAGTADPPTNGNDSRGMFGAAAGATPDNYVWAGGSNAGDGTMQTISYCRAGECIGELDASAVTSPDGRASVSAWLTDGFRLNWTERASTRRILWVALKGAKFKLGDLLTQTDTTTDIVETGVGFQPIGLLLLSHTTTASTVNVAQAHDMWSMGGYDGTNQRAMACIDEDNTANAEVATAVEHDNVYIKMTTSDTVDSTMQVNSLDSDGFTSRMSLAGAAQNFVWYLAVAAAGSGGFTGTGSAAASPFAASASGAESFTATSSAAMAPFAVAAAGLVTFLATGSAGASPFAASGTGSEAFDGSCTAALAAFAASCSGEETFAGTGSAAAQPFAADAAGANGAAVTGSGSAAASPFAAGGSGEETFSGTGSAAASPFACSASAAETFTGTAAAACQSFAADGNGTIGNAFNGSATAALAAFACSASGLESFAATATAAASPFAVDGVGAEEFAGSATVALQEFACSGAGANLLGITGSASCEFSSFGAAGVGTHALPVTGTGDVAVASFACVALGVNDAVVGPIGATMIVPDDPPIVAEFISADEAAITATFPDFD